jgi:PLP dependent protein
LARQNYRITVYQQLLKALKPRNATLVAVSKMHPPERVLNLYEQGQRVFGENRVQELAAKAEQLPPDIVWHLIGHLQTNKVRFIAPFVGMIQSVDTLRLLQEIEKQAAKVGRTLDCLLQFHIATEDTKFGLNEQEARDLLESPAYRAMTHVRICGVMGMATFTDDTERVRTEFRHLRGIFDRLRETYFRDAPHFREISMGMSSDWEIAVEEGSTMVRIGSLLFGDRSTAP